MVDACKSQDYATAQPPVLADRSLTFSTIPPPRLLTALNDPCFPRLQSRQISSAPSMARLLVDGRSKSSPANMALFSSIPCETLYRNPNGGCCYFRWEHERHRLYCESRRVCLILKIFKLIEIHSVHVYNTAIKPLYYPTSFLLNIIRCNIFPSKLS